MNQKLEMKKILFSTFLLLLAIVVQAQIHEPVKFKSELKTLPAGEAEIVFNGVIDKGLSLIHISRPDIVQDIHRKYLVAGADIIETNTFSSTRVSMADYHVQEYVREINSTAVKLAREVADEFTALTPDKPRFVAGSIGPTNKTCSMSPDVNNPAFRALSYDELATAYREQMEIMLETGIDALLIETIFDTLNAKADIYAAEQAMDFTGIHVPLMLSVTVSDTGGRTLSGQTLEAFLASVQPVSYTHLANRLWTYSISLLRRWFDYWRRFGRFG